MSAPTTKRRQMVKSKRQKAKRALQRLRAQYEENPQTNGEREAAAKIEEDWDVVEEALMEE